MSDTELVITVASSLTAAIAVLAFFHARHSLKYHKWYSAFNSFRSLVQENEFKHMMLAHQVDISKMGVSCEIIEDLEKRIYTLWMRVHIDEYGRKLWFLSKYKQRVKFVRKRKLGKWFKRNTHSGDIVRTTLFVALWPFLRQFWSRTNRSVLVPIVDAIVLETIDSEDYVKFEPYSELVTAERIRENREKYKNDFEIWYPIA